MKQLFFIALFGGFAVINANAQEKSDSNRQDHGYDKNKVEKDRSYDMNKDMNKTDQDQSYNQNNNRMDIDRSDVPEAVKSAFEAKFANASDVEWKNKNGNYKVEFDMNGKDHMATMDRTGRVISQGTEIEKEELPAAINDAVKNNHQNDKIDDAYRVEKDGRTMYMVKLEGNEKKKLMFDEQGNMVKK